MVERILGFRLKSKEVNRQAAIELATKVRDIRYALGADGNTENLFEDGVGGCARKHLYLLPRLQQMGYRVNIGITQFDWRRLPIPAEILSLLEQPVQHHMFLYVGADRPVAELDVTRDKGMKPLGFPVFEWDGVSPTGLTVNAINAHRQGLFILKARSLTSSTLRQLRNLDNQPTFFNDAFNGWLTAMRATP